MSDATPCKFREAIGQYEERCEIHDREKSECLVEAALEKRDKAWVDALHGNGVVDMVDADGSNKEFLLDEVKKRYETA